MLFQHELLSLPNAAPVWNFENDGDCAFTAKSCADLPYIEFVVSALEQGAQVRLFADGQELITPVETQYSKRIYRGMRNVYKFPLSGIGTKKIEVRFTGKGRLQCARLTADPAYPLRHLYF
ncbi:MAG: hypothetical protein HFK10_05735 [Clostridia bacterium]|nr:hypothetical protein [Clostridia bacterium]